MTGARVLLLCLTVFCLIVSGCASLRPEGTLIHASSTAEIESENADDTVATPSGEGASSDFSPTSNSQVKKWVEYFSRKDRERFQRYLNRGLKYRKVIEDLLIEHELPAELYFLALVESGYQNHARSQAKAVGVWQFMPATARRYGLQVDRYIDERKDPIRATESAAKYLRDLYNIFGSWPLAMAAYNAGEYRIIRAILKGKSRDFWVLSNLKLLPPETVEYVPKIMAAALIGENPRAYGFLVEDAKAYPSLVSVEVPSPVRISDVARIAGISSEDVRNVNPHLLGTYTPANVTRYEIWFPEHSAATAKEKITAVPLKDILSKKSIRGKTGAVIPKHALNRHVVKKGENLSIIAQRYGATVGYLRKVNGLKRSRILPGMELRISSRAYRPDSVIRYRVQAGESLVRIAMRFRTTVKDLKNVNSIQGDQIFSGQTLLIRKNQ